MRVGYTTGVFDLFHVGHLNIMSARALCDRLIVGVSTDGLAMEYKHKSPVITYRDRAEIVRSLECVNTVIRREIMDKVEEWRRLKFDVVFVGDDWFEDKRWRRWEAALIEHGVEIVYLPNTPGISTTEIIDHIKKGVKT